MSTHTPISSALFAIVELTCDVKGRMKPSDLEWCRRARKNEDQDEEEEEEKDVDEFALIDVIVICDNPSRYVDETTKVTQDHWEKLLMSPTKYGLEHDVPKEALSDLEKALPFSNLSIKGSAKYISDSDDYLDLKNRVFVDPFFKIHPKSLIIDMRGSLLWSDMNKKHARKIRFRTRHSLDMEYSEEMMNEHIDADCSSCGTVH